MANKGTERDGEFGKAYILWGGMFDTRDIQLLHWKGKWQWEDLTGGHMTLHNVVHESDTPEMADIRLMDYVFELGEPGTWLQLGDKVIRSNPFK